MYFEIEADLDELEQKVHLMCVSYQYFEFWKDFLYKPHRPNKRGKKKEILWLMAIQKDRKDKVHIHMYTACSTNMCKESRINAQKILTIGVLSHKYSMRHK